ncbi:MAG TPA: arsenate reductase ArsC [Candidatus Limnocylindrales bacterium]
MIAAPTRVLFVSTGAACRAVFAHALLRHVGGSRYAVSCAGVDPTPIDPLTLEILSAAGIDATDIRSTALDDAHRHEYDYVITLCDDARLACPIFPGADQSMHWGYASPQKLSDPQERRAAFERVFVQLSERIRQFVVISGRGAAPREPSELEFQPG